jgi:hypothetical protein
MVRTTQFEAARLAQVKGKEVPAGGKVFGMFAEIAFVEIQGRFSIELQQDVVVGLCDESFRAERHPPSATALADFEVFAIKTQTRHAGGENLRIVQDGGALEALPVGGQTAGDFDPGRKELREAGGQGAAVDGQAVGEHEDMHKILRKDAFGQGPAQGAHVGMVFQAGHG